MQLPSLSSHQTFSWPPHKGSTVPTKQFLIAPHPQPWQLLTCVLSAWINLFWMFHICGIHLQQVTFCVWLLSPCVTFSRSMYFVDCYRYVFPLCSGIIFRCRHTQCAYFFVHWWAFGGYPQIGCYEECCYGHLKNHQTFPQWLHHSTFCWRRLSVPVPSHPHQCLFSSFLKIHYIYPNEYEVKSHCGFDLHSLMTNDTEHVFLGLLAIRISSSEKCLLTSLAHF